MTSEVFKPAFTAIQNGQINLSSAVCYAHLVTALPNTTFRYVNQLSIVPENSDTNYHAVLLLGRSYNNGILTFNDTLTDSINIDSGSIVGIVVCVRVGLTIDPNLDFPLCFSSTQNSSAIDFNIVPRGEKLLIKFGPKGALDLVSSIGYKSPIFRGAFDNKGLVGIWGTKYFTQSFVNPTRTNFDSNNPLAFLTFGIRTTYPGVSIRNNSSLFTERPPASTIEANFPFKSANFGSQLLAFDFGYKDGSDIKCKLGQLVTPFYGYNVDILALNLVFFGSNSIAPFRDRDNSYAEQEANIVTNPNWINLGAPGISFNGNSFSPAIFSIYSPDYYRYYKLVCTGGYNPGDSNFGYIGSIDFYDSILSIKNGF